MYQFSFSSMRRACTAGIFAAGALVFVAGQIASTPASAAPQSPAEVAATYKISLNGFELGTFQFGSNIERNQYTLDTDVEISALLGVFHWKGSTRSTGTLSAMVPKPAGFRFDFESSAKNGSVNIGFGEKGVESLSIEPLAFTEPGEIPLTPAHLNGVLDPLSAIMALTHTDAPSPCGRKLAVFDGKQRFDLDFRYVRNERLAGTNEIAVVCRIKYQPIAGYAPNEEILSLAKSDAIEVVFRPVPAAKLMLPQSLSLPTPAGTARLDLTQVRIKAARGQVASVN